MPEPRVVDSITVQQDVGGPYPVWKKIVLDLYDDGTVRCRPLADTPPSTVMGDQRDNPLSGRFGDYPDGYTAPSPNAGRGA